MTISKTTTKSDSPDGRALRGDRNRQQVLDALLALVEEGNLQPTAQQVSDRAGVGRRTVFRHFSDKEALFNALDQHLDEAQPSPFVGGDRDGSLSERIRHAAQRHDQAFEKSRQVFLATQSQLWKSKTLQKNWLRKRKHLRHDLQTWLPEVKSLSPSRQAAAEAAMSFEHWYQLRYDQRLSRKATVAAINEMLCLLFETTPG